MTNQEKALSRLMFQRKIYQADGQTFENLFTEIMTASEPCFQQIKPWGNIGDRKNDGYIRKKGIYYQVFAPEDIRKSYPDVIKKLNADFKGLLAQWSPVNEYFFVVNDKYHGVNADSETEIQNLINDNGLQDGGFITPSRLESILFLLPDDQIIKIVGFSPDPESLSRLDYSILNEVISHVMKMPATPMMAKIEFPDWDEKIKFNGLSPRIKAYLDLGSQNVAALNNYLANQSFLAQELQEKLTGVYQQEKSSQVNSDPANQYVGDEIFWNIVQRCIPKNEQHYVAAVTTVIAKYFETCDVFEKNK